MQGTTLQCNSRESSRRSRRLQLKPPSRAHVGGPEIACNRSMPKSAQGCDAQQHGKPMRKLSKIRTRPPVPRTRTAHSRASAQAACSGRKQKAHAGAELHHRRQNTARSTAAAQVRKATTVMIARYLVAWRLCLLAIRARLYTRAVPAPTLFHCNR
jgi:hypothetical protein